MFRYAEEEAQNAAVLFIGVKDNGTPEDRQVNLDSLQRTLSEQVAKAYPSAKVFCC